MPLLGKGTSTDDLSVREGAWEVAAVPSPWMRHRWWTKFCPYLMVTELCSAVTRLTSATALQQVICIPRFLQDTCENLTFVLAGEKTPQMFLMLAQYLFLSVLFSAVP